MDVSRFVSLYRRKSFALIIQSFVTVGLQYIYVPSHELDSAIHKW